jgi:glycosyltransferase involved in cell wall biosynthesis
MWPWFSSRFSRRLNCKLLGRHLNREMRYFSEPPIAITTLPIVADLIGVLPVQRWVYYCVDDFSVWPGLDQRTIGRMEAELVRTADVVIAVSETLQDKLSRMGREARLLTHGVDLNLWNAQSLEDSTLPELSGLQRPLVVFWGLIDRRIDVDLVRQLATDLAIGTILLVGPELNQDPALQEIQRVVRLPPLPFERLPLLAQQAAVLIMPYADLPVTRALQPLKLKEYLATGKPAVARDLPAVRPWADCLDVADSPQAFSQAVRLRLAEGLPAAQRQARQRLNLESWAAKARDFEEWALTLEPSCDAVHCS